MFKILSITVAAAAVLAAIAATPGIVSGVEASAPLPTVNAAAKGDRLDVNAAAPDCTQQVWPYIATRCLRDTSGRGVRHVRIVGNHTTVTGAKRHGAK